MGDFRIFVSAVTSEFGEARREIVLDLERRGLVVKVQENFRQEPGIDTTLEMIHDYIRRCNAVVCIVGKRSGAKPPSKATGRFSKMRDMLPSGIVEASYTQWEYFFAHYYKKPIYRYLANEKYKPDKPKPTGQDYPKLQEAFVSYLINEEDINRSEFSSRDEACRQVMWVDWPRKPTRRPNNIPRRSLSRGFQGRAIKRLHRVISDPSDDRPVAIYGLGGVGKTTLAVEYAQRHEIDYTALLFVPAATPQVLATSLAELANPCALEDRRLAKGDLEERIAEVYTWLEQHRDWLLIFDNIDDETALAAVVERFPRLHGGKVVLTGRFSRLPVDVRPFELGSLERNDGARFLLERTKGRRKDTLNDNDVARELAVELGGLPLALEQAGAYIAEESVRIADYLSRLRRAPEAPAVWRTLATSIERLTTPGRQLLECASFVSSEPIPRDLLDDMSPNAVAQPGARSALSNLIDYSLATIDRGERAPHFRIHRLVQDAMRSLMDSTNATLRLNEAAKCIENDLERDEVRPQVIAHAVSVLYFLQRDEYRDSSARDLYDKLVQRVIYGLLNLGPKNISPEHLAGVLAPYYELEPLSRAIVDFRLQNPQGWARIEPSLLAENNYVLRYAIARELGDACIRQQRLVAKMKERLRQAEAMKDVDEFEVTAYALAHRYTSKPRSIDQSYINILLNHSTYLGNSIVGHLLHNLVFQVSRAKWRDIRAMVKSDQFWNSSWPFVRLQVCEIEAAHTFMAGKGASLPTPATKELEECYSGLIAIGERINVAKEATKNRRLRQLVDGYFELGGKPEAIRKVAQQLGAAPNRRELFWLFLSHPRWYVAEEAASVLSSLAEKDDEYLRMIEEFMSEERWCIQYGASEAACCAYTRKADPFYASVHKFYNHSSCRIRGLCAENLVSMILTSGADKREELMTKFNEAITCWLNDPDCWVSEHIFRLFQTLQKRGVDCSKFLPKQVSPLFGDRPDWYEIDRGEFLRHIEQRNKKLARGSFSGQLN
jgi:NB-ARC domain/Domain of unknown function (DUF4062)